MTESKEKDASWSCQTCTLMNTQDNLRCECCGTRKRRFVPQKKSNDCSESPPQVKRKRVNECKQEE